MRLAQADADELTSSEEDAYAATSTPGLRSPLPRLAHLHRDCAHRCHIRHICTGTALTAATSAPGPRRHVRYDESVPRFTLLPTHLDPKLWHVNCEPGKERDVATRLMQVQWLCASAIHTIPDRSYTSALQYS